MNPAVQKNLNDLIKTQRDEVIRISQTMSFRDPSPGKQAEEPRVAAFDESLSSRSKLISVPNQFTNKLKQKAEDFEQQRIRDTSPHLARAVETSLNHASPYNQNNASGLYATWKHGDQSQSQNYDRKSISPIKRSGPANLYSNQNPMQASLAGSSQLQYGINETPINDRNISPLVSSGYVGQGIHNLQQQRP